ncbi:MAG: LuxR C-terminal-related transcriptional regulator [Bacteroidales bacterium]
MMTGFRQLPDYITQVSDPLYKEINSCIQILEGVARLTHQSMSLIDFFKGALLYISDNPLFLCGLTPQEVIDLGVDFNQKYVSRIDNEFIREVTRSWLRFIEAQPLEERITYSLRFNYHLDHRLICVSMTPVFLSADGKPWLVICNAKISTHSNSGHAVIFKDNSLKNWYYSTSSKHWIQSDLVLLSDIEQEILRLSIQGKRESEICQLIFRSKDGLKSIKRKLFHKMDVTNITEAVSFAISYGLI